MLEIILHTVEHTLKDTINLLPFLFLTFILMEYFEHKLSKKNKKLIQKAGPYGPVVGSILGAFPQCGFSVAATNLYATRIISLGTLIAIYLSTSDEMLPILLSKGVRFPIILKIISIKVIVGIIAGLVIDFIYRKTKNKKDLIKDFCEEEHCDCHHSLLKSTIRHTLNIFIFIVLSTFVLNVLIHTIGEDNLSKLLLQGSIFGPFLSSIIGLIPNCASSVVITELYLSNAITLGSTLAGLLTGSGVALLVLFKTNKDIKENVKILTMLYMIGAFVGVLIDLVKIVI